MAQLAIKGHPTKGAKVIEILRMLGGINTLNCAGLNEDSFYYIGKSEIICRCCMTHNRMVFTLEEFLEKFPYKVGDKVQHKGATYCDPIFEVGKMQWVDNHVEYTTKHFWYNNCHNTFTAEYLQPYKEEAMEEKITIQDIRDNNADWLLNKLQEMSAEGALQTISYLYDELHKPQYPNTYEDCCKILGYTQIYRGTLLSTFQQILICRDAYWEKVGVQPWRPDWDTSEVKFTIVECAGKVVKTSDMCNKRILAFPTEEMRDAFFDNFKDLIESCKELL